MVISINCDYIRIIPLLNGVLLIEKYQMILNKLPISILLCYKRFQGLKGA